MQRERHPGEGVRQSRLPDLADTYDTHRQRRVSTRAAPPAVERP